MLSTTHRCKLCNKQIKERLVKIKKQAPKLCYQCWKTAELSRARQESQKKNGV